MSQENVEVRDGQARPALGRTAQQTHAEDVRDAVAQRGYSCMLDRAYRGGNVSLSSVSS